VTVIALLVPALVLAAFGWSLVLPRIAPAWTTLETIAAQLPPGDVYEAALINDTPRTVEVFGCDDDDCTRGWDPATLAAGENAGWNEDPFVPVQLGIASSSTHVLLGCLSPPRATSVDDEPQGTVTVKASDLLPCPGTGRVVTYFDPFS
jgi:hypothetical protein